MSCSYNNGMKSKIRILLLSTLLLLLFVPVIVKANTCGRDSYTMAFLLVNEEDKEIPEGVIDNLNSLRVIFSEYFYNATSQLATIDTSDGIYTLNITEDMIEHPNIDLQKVMNKFYDTYPDDFDFVTVFTTFPSRGMFQTTVKKNLPGTGGGISNLSSYYGSDDRLLGILFMYNSSRREPSDLFYPGFIGGMLHELGHYWCCYAGDNFVRGEDNAQLEIIQQGIHYYRGLDSPYETGTPMNSDNWISNGDGTYRRENQDGPEKYHPFTLYFMGLLPRSEYDTKFTVYDAGIPGQDFDDQNAVFYKQVDVWDLIAVEGERCPIENNFEEIPEISKTGFIAIVIVVVIMGAFLIKKNSISK